MDDFAEKLKAQKQRGAMVGALIKYYKQYAPEKVKRVDAALAHFKGKEGKLLEDLEKKYGGRTQHSRNTHATLTQHSRISHAILTQYSRNTHATLTQYPRNTHTGTPVPLPPGPPTVTFKIGYVPQQMLRKVGGRIRSQCCKQCNQ
jgi:hypothetical protein